MADNDSDTEISISTCGDMTWDGMSMEASRGITDEHSDSSSSLLSANDTTPTNSADTTPTNSIPVCISKPTIVPHDQNAAIAALKGQFVGHCHHSIVFSKGPQTFFGNLLG